MNGTHAEPTRCFLHIPKSAGTSIHLALERALPPGSVSPKRCDTYGFVDFHEYDRLASESRALIAVDADDLRAMRTCRAVSGHFTLGTLLQLAPPRLIATVLREPRARLLSLYAFARSTPTLITMWDPYPRERSSGVQARRTLDEYLSERLVAPDTDNQVCRLLLDGDARIPPLDFIAQSDIEAIAAAAVERLDAFGFVGILELGKSAIWKGLEQVFACPLADLEANVTSEVAQPIDDGATIRMPVTHRTLSLLDERTAADSIVYEQSLARGGVTGVAAARLREAAFAEQLVRLGEVIGIEESERARARVREELRNAQDELGRHREWLQEIQRSSSWRLTAPLRAAKRFVRRTHRVR